MSFSPQGYTELVLLRGPFPAAVTRLGIEVGEETLIVLNPVGHFVERGVDYPNTIEETAPGSFTNYSSRLSNVTPADAALSTRDELEVKAHGFS